jgi:hypothetical protein
MIRGWRFVVWAVLVFGLLYALRGGKRVQPLQKTDPGTDVPRPLGEKFDPASCGTISGRITWDGPVPTVEPFPVFHIPYVPRAILSRSNPLQPKIDAKTRGVSGGVVFLKGIDPARSKPWGWPEVEVGCRGLQIEVLQGQSTRTIGLVLPGEPVRLVSHEGDMHSVRARGRSFFTQMLTEVNVPVERSFPRRGLVELSSGSSYYWARSYLYVDDVPYYAFPDADGGFSLTDVPDGEYELVFWMPNWKPGQKDRDPEALEIVSMAYRAPLLKSTKVTVKRGEIVEFALAVSEAMFE